MCLRGLINLNLSIILFTTAWFQLIFFHKNWILWQEFFYKKWRRTAENLQHLILTPQENTERIRQKILVCSLKIIFTYFWVLKIVNVANFTCHYCPVLPSSRCNLNCLCDLLNLFLTCSIIGVEVGFSHCNVESHGSSPRLPTNRRKKRLK